MIYNSTSSWLGATFLLSTEVFGSSFANTRDVHCTAGNHPDLRQIDSPSNSRMTSSMPNLLSKKTAFFLIN